LAGDFDHIRYLDAYLNPEEDFTETVRSCFSEIAEEDTVLILTDLKSGSVTQAMLSYATR
jgi:mannose/fructose-specific phosphotransferase system component IIA